MCVCVCVCVCEIYIQISSYTFNFSTKYYIFIMKNIPKKKKKKEGRSVVDHCYSFSKCSKMTVVLGTVGQRLRLPASTAGNLGSIPCWGTKIPPAAVRPKKNDGRVIRYISL